MAENKTNPKTTASPSTDGGDLGAAQLQQAFDKAQEQGFFGEEVDQTPNEAYTLQGGPAGVGTPEGDRQTGRKG
jgi:hypothetical protein